MASKPDQKYGCAVCGDATGTHRGHFLGHPPTGRRIRFRGIEILAIDPTGRITERWGEWDGLDLLEQLRQGQAPTYGLSVIVPTIVSAPTATV